MNTMIVEAAKAYLAKGWVPIAQGPDDKGLPKKPLAKGWPHLTVDHPDVRKQNWGRAVGIGILLGAASRNLAVIDLDDGEFATAVWANIARYHLGLRFVWTAKGRGHLYFYEDEPSEYSKRNVEWEGRTFDVELRAGGARLATVPPSPGYVLAQDVEPTHVPSLQAVWGDMVRKFGARDVTPPKSPYTPWETTVGQGDRNETLFTEAVALARGNMPIDLAMRHMEIRWEEAYSGQMDQKQAQDTVKSAYRHVAKKRAIAENKRYEVEKTWQ